MDEGRSKTFEFEYRPVSKPVGTHETRRSAGPRRGPRRRGTIWILWFCIAMLGAGGSAVMALRVGEVRMIGDGSFWTAVIGIAVVLVVSLPGFSMYRLACFSASPNWHERVWKPTAWVRLSLGSSLVAALWCGYLIAIRIARGWPT